MRYSNLSIIFFLAIVLSTGVSAVAGDVCTSNANRDQCVSCCDTVDGVAGVTNGAARLDFFADQLNVVIPARINDYTAQRNNLQGLASRDAAQEARLEFFNDQLSIVLTARRTDYSKQRTTLDIVFCKLQCPVQAAALCGNGVPDPDEQCDDGNTVNTDACTNECTNAACGDTFVQAGVEQCEDGNTETEACTYGQQSCLVCSETCRSVAGAVSFCSDGQINGPEVCDGDGDACVINGYGGEKSCKTDCSGFETLCVALESCGDGLVQAVAGETCDLGAPGTNNGPNSVAGENGQPLKCNLQCNGITPAVCGNGVVEALEVCDELGDTTNGGACNAACTALTSCGDGTVQAPNGQGQNEQCEGNAPVDCKMSGTNYDGTKSCDAALCGFNACTTTQSCGDSQVTGVEACDTGLGAVSCTLPNGYAGTRTCSVGCASQNACVQTENCGDGVRNGPELTDPNGCDEGVALNGQPNHCNLQCNGITPAVCGNSAKEAGEICDLTDLGGSACTDQEFATGQNFAGGTLACNAQCNGFVTTGCFRCGDGVLNDGEQCDVVASTGAILLRESTTCQVNGFVAGSLSCTNNCQVVSVSTCTMCGNTVVDVGEVCDGPSACVTDKSYQGTKQCNALCTDFADGAGTACVAAGSCGDGVLNNAENADLTKRGPEVCELGTVEPCTTTDGYAGTKTCHANDGTALECRFDACVPTGSCGDGIIQDATHGGPEQCDGSALGVDAAGAENSCISLNQGFDGGTLGCKSAGEGQCTFDVVQCTRPQVDITVNVDGGEVTLEGDTLNPQSRTITQSTLFNLQRNAPFTLIAATPYVPPTRQGTRLTFTQWVFGTEQSTQNPLQIIADATRTYDPQWRTDHQVSINVEATAADSALSGFAPMFVGFEPTGEPVDSALLGPFDPKFHEAMSRVTVTATPPALSKYQLVKWKLDGLDAGTTSPFTLQVDRPYALTAVFTCINGEFRGLDNIDALCDLATGCTKAQRCVNGAWVEATAPETVTS